MKSVTTPAAKPQASAAGMLGLDHGHLEPPAVHLDGANTLRRPNETGLSK